MPSAHALVATAIVLLLAGCASAPPPEPPAVDPATAARVMVFPVVDARAKSSTSPVSMEKCKDGIDQETYDYIFRRKNAISKLPPPALSTDVPGREELEAGTAEWFRRADMAEVDYAFFLFVRTFDVRGGSFDYRGEGFLVDPRAGTVFWKKSFEDTKWIGILNGIFSGVIEVVPVHMACSAYGRMIGSIVGGMPQLVRHDQPK